MIEAHEVNRTTVPGPQDSNREREKTFSPTVKEVGTGLGGKENWFRYSELYLLTPWGRMKLSFRSKPRVSISR